MACRDTGTGGTSITLIPTGGGHCVLKWILLGHLKPTPNAIMDTISQGPRRHQKSSGRFGTNFGASLF